MGLSFDKVVGVDGGYHAQKMLWDLGLKVVRGRLVSSQVFAKYFGHCLERSFVPSVTALQMA